MSKGKLIRVELQPGRFVKMYEADAVAQGLIPAAEPGARAKAQPQGGNKQRLPQADKAAALPVEEPAAEQEADDLTTIAGVGPATARALAANGITTFAQLREAGELDFLTAAANDAITAWRESGG